MNSILKTENEHTYVGKKENSNLIDSSMPPNVYEVQHAITTEFGKTAYYLYIRLTCNPLDFYVRNSDGPPVQFLT